MNQQKQKEIKIVQNNFLNRLKAHIKITPGFFYRLRIFLTLQLGKKFHFRQTLFSGMKQPQQQGEKY